MSDTILSETERLLRLIADSEGRELDEFVDELVQLHPRLGGGKWANYVPGEGDSWETDAQPGAMAREIVRPAAWSAIKALRSEAVRHGDTEQVDLCDRALGGDYRAFARCRSVIEAAGGLLSVPEWRCALHPRTEGNAPATPGSNFCCRAYEGRV